MNIKKALLYTKYQILNKSFNFNWIYIFTLKANKKNCLGPRKLKNIALNIELIDIAIVFSLYLTRKHLCFGGWIKGLFRSEFRMNIFNTI